MESSLFRSAPAPSDSNIWFWYVALRRIRTLRSTKGSTGVTTAAYLYLTCDIGQTKDNP
jgi:hypothetical protein